MSDVYCRKCSEPWDAWGAAHGEMDRDEWRRFRLGEGCPACRFGTVCTACDGSGKEPDSSYGTACPVCLGQRLVRVRRIPDSVNPRFRAWAYGYEPNMVTVSAEVVKARFLRVERKWESREGIVEEVTLRYFECWDDAPTCLWCGGTGKPGPASEDDVAEATLAFLHSLDDATDGDEVYDAIEALENMQS